jgi:hypothetical protein
MARIKVYKDGRETKDFTCTAEQVESALAANARFNPGTTVFVDGVHVQGPALPVRNTVSSYRPRRVAENDIFGLGYCDDCGRPMRGRRCPACG